MLLYTKASFFMYELKANTKIDLRETGYGVENSQAVIYK